MLSKPLDNAECQELAESIIAGLTPIFKSIYNQDFATIQFGFSPKTGNPQISVDLEQEGMQVYFDVKFSRFSVID